MKMTQALLISFFTGMATLLGAFVIIWFKEPDKKMMALYLGLSGGIMIFIVLVDLLPFALEHASLGIIWSALIAGILFMLITQVSVSRMFKHSSSLLRMAWMIVLAMALHNLPEGLAVGAGLEAQYGLGIMIALSIALHNIPEGIAVAAPFLAAGVSRRVILWIVFAVSLFIPLGTIIGEGFISLDQWSLGAAISLASGAMLYIVVREILPAAYRYHRTHAFIGLIGALMLVWVMHSYYTG